MNSAKRLNSRDRIVQDNQQRKPDLVFYYFHFTDIGILLESAETTFDVSNLLERASIILFDSGARISSTLSAEGDNASMIFSAGGAS